MKQYFIREELRDAVIGWCVEQHMVMRKDYTWFPFYFSNNKEAFRLDIFNDEDAILFILQWRQDIIK